MFQKNENCSYKTMKTCEEYRGGKKAVTFFNRHVEEEN